jgi:glycosyltransferase involved in cell wall biosynthesis
VRLTDSVVALRAASRLRTRHDHLRVTLVGEITELQALRLHAGSLGLAEHLSIVPMDALLMPGALDAAAVWVTAQGDDGGAALVAAMMRRIPTIVPRGADTEALVAPRITGFIADDADLAGTVAAIAHLLADADDYQSMGTAAAARAERLHGWDAYVDRVLDALGRVQSASRKAA